MTTRFTDGTTGSASQVAQAFSELRTQGQAAIDQLVVLRENTLLLFNNALSGLNGKRVRANRLPQIGVAANFVTSDLQDINQPITTATVRCDSNNVSLRERAAPGEAIVSNVRFSASEGTIQALNQPQTGNDNNIGALYRVATNDGSTPEGVFDIQLQAPVTTSLIIFDMMDMPSTGTIDVQISVNGISYTDMLSITRNGYRLAAWFAPQEIQYVRINITPAMPDVLGGTLFTFGLTDLHAFSVQYHLRSDVYTNQIEITPSTANLQFITPTVPGLNYFLSLAGLPAIEIFPGQVVPIPGTSEVTQTSVGYSSTGSTYAKLNYILPTNTYLSSLRISDHSTQVEMRLAPGLSHTVTGLTNQYVTIDGSGNLYLVNYTSADSGRTFDIAFTEGPATVTAALQVELTSGDLNNTPIYSGAQLIEA